MSDPAPEVDRLAQLARQAATEVADVPALLSIAIRAAVASGADPWVIGGVLIGGLAHTLATIPPERRRDAELAAVQLVIDQLRTAGAG